MINKNFFKLPSFSFDSHLIQSKYQEEQDKIALSNGIKFHKLTCLVALLITFILLFNLSETLLHKIQNIAMIWIVNLIGFFCLCFAKYLNTNASKRKYLKLVAMIPSIVAGPLGSLKNILESPEDHNIFIILNFYLVLLNCIYIVRNIQLIVMVEIINSGVFIGILHLTSGWNWDDIIKIAASFGFNFLICYSFEFELRKNFGLREKNAAQTRMHNEFLNAQTNPIIIFTQGTGIDFMNIAAKEEFETKDLDGLFHKLSQFKCSEGKLLLEYLNQGLSKQERTSDSVTKIIPEKIFYRKKPGSNEDDIYEVKLIASTFFREHSSVGLILININQRIKWEQMKIQQRCSNLLLSGVSHELRTPLNGIRGMISMAKSCTNQEGRKYLSTAKASIFSLGSKIDDILDYSLDASGDLVLHIEKVNIHGLLKDIFKALKYEAREKNIKLVFDVDSSVEFISTDPKRLTQILMNLLSNALNYTIKGKIILRVKSKPGNQIKISIIDTGIGLSQKQIRNLFLYQCDQFNQSILDNRKSGLPGIGLQVTKALCQKMKCELNVKSQKGRGSKFYFQFPQQFDENPDIELEEDKNESEVLYPKIIDASHKITECLTIPNEMMPSSKKLSKIEDYVFHHNKNSFDNSLISLVVDDIALNRTILKALLMKQGIQAHQATNGAEAVLHFKRIWDPNFQFVIFMDLQMPIMDGYEATKEIRSLTKSDVNPFIVAVTAFAGEEERRNTKAVGMNLFKSKPITSKDVKQVISIISKIIY